MKKTFLALLVALMAITVASAQPQAGQRRQGMEMTTEKMAEHHVAMLDKELSLTPDQKTAITAIYAEQAEQMRAQMQQKRDANQAQPKPEDMKEHRKFMQEQQEAVDAKVAALLTPEQKEKFEQLKTRKDNCGPRHMGPGHGHHHGDMKPEGKAPGHECGKEKAPGHECKQAEGKAKQHDCKEKAEGKECTKDCCNKEKK